MKVGILTYHFGTNYGGVLQCYALCDTIRRLGHSVTVVNYIPIELERNNFKSLLTCYARIIRRDGFRSLGFAFAVALNRRRQVRAFDAFRDLYLRVGRVCKTLPELAEECKLYDAVVVGSDQVWAPAHRKSGAYFLNFGDAYQGLRIAYAPCCAVTSGDEQNQLNFLQACLQRFSMLSVRNEETLEFVRKIINKDVPIVADPTLLMDFGSESRHDNNDYILVYLLGHEILGGHEGVIDRVKREYGNLPIYAIIPTNSNPRMFEWIDKAMYSVTPLEWVRLISHAKFLYTDSFHGVVFALKYRVPFLAFYTEKIRASRFLSLRKTYNLSNVISRADLIQSKSLAELQPDFDVVHSIIARQVDTSISFILNALKK